jgi:hypothetical protein
MNRPFAGGAHILVIAFDVNKVTLIQKACGFIVLGLRFRHQRHDSALGAAQNLLAFEVAAVG